MHERAETVVLFSGGGTGGHLYPALAIAERLVEARPDVRPHFIGAARGIESRVLPGTGFPYELLPVEGFARGKGLWFNRAVAGRLLVSLASVGKLIRQWRPKVTVVTGGYAGAPAGLGSALLGVPLVLQEQNSFPGATTRVLGRFARQIHLAFPEALETLSGRARTRSEISGNPIRAPMELSAESAYQSFGLDANMRTLLVVGGSQGSAAINSRLLDALIAIGEGRAREHPAVQLLWATGPTHYEGVSSALARTGSPDWVHILPYIDDMPAALTIADAALSRAGAMTTSEFLAWGIPSLLIPLPSAAANHQELNARALSAQGVAHYLPESEADGLALWEHLGRLLGDSVALATMSRAARERGRPGAAQHIAKRIAELLPPEPGAGP